MQQKTKNKNTVIGRRESVIFIFGQIRMIGGKFGACAVNWEQQKNFGLEFPF